MFGYLAAALSSRVVQAVPPEELTLSTVHGIASTYATGTADFVAEGSAFGQSRAHAQAFEPNLTRFVEGLELYDDFVRADSPTLGNGWVESGQIKLENFTARFDPGGQGYMWQGSQQGVDLPEEAILQMNSQGAFFAENGTVFALNIRWHPPTGSINKYSATHNRESGIRIYEYNGGSATVLEGPSGSRDSWADDFKERIVTYNLETGSLGIANRIDRIDTGSELDSDFAPGPGFLLMEATESTTHSVSTRDKVGIDVASSGRGSVARFFLCGRIIEVTDMPSGWFAQLQGPAVTRSAVVETGGTSSFAPDTWALPITSVEVFNASSESVAILTPSGGIWGGDKFTLSTSA